MISSKLQSKFLRKKRSQSSYSRPTLLKQKNEEPQLSLNSSFNDGVNSNKQSKGKLSKGKEQQQIHAKTQLDSYDSIDNRKENYIYQNQLLNMTSAYETPKFSFRNSYQNYCLPDDTNDAQNSNHSQESSPTQQDLLPFTSQREDHFSFGKQFKAIESNSEDCYDEKNSLNKQGNIQSSKYSCQPIHSNAFNPFIASTKNRNGISPFSENQCSGQQGNTKQVMINWKSQPERNNFQNQNSGIKNSILQPTLKPKQATLQFKVKSLIKSQKQTVQATNKPVYNFYNFLDKENVLSSSQTPPPPPKAPPKKILKPVNLLKIYTTQCQSPSFKITKPPSPLANGIRLPQKASLNLSFDGCPPLSNSKQSNNSSVREQGISNMSFDISDSNPIIEESQKLNIGQFSGSKQRQLNLHRQQKLNIQM